MSDLEPTGLIGLNFSAYAAVKKYVTWKEVHLHLLLMLQLGYVMADKLLQHL